MRCLYFTSRWPLRNYSAGHERIFSLIGSIINRDYEVTVLCSEETTEQNTRDIGEFPVELVECQPGKLPRLQPHKFAIFDAYLTANRFAEDLYNRSNKTIQILDLQDRHALRQERQKRFEGWSQDKPATLLPQGQPMWTLERLPEEERAINRADMVISCSDFQTFNMRETSQANMCWASFLYPTEDFSKELADKLYRPFEMRKNFVFVGNMLHHPNIDAVRVLLEHIWPKVRELGCKEELHIYGSEFPRQLYQHKSKFREKGIRLMGQLTDAEEIGKYIAMLAPLRFGAGVKGKIVDAWMEHTPVVTTPIGSEGMFLETIDESACKPSVYYTDKAELTEQEQLRQNRLLSYYRSNSFVPPADNLTFGGLWQNFTSDEFAASMLQLTRDGVLWNRLREVGAETLVKNHSEEVGNRSFFGGLASTELRLRLLRQRPSCRLEWERQRTPRRTSR